MSDEDTSNPADDIPGETPVQKALRLKTAKLDARAKPRAGSDACH